MKSDEIATFVINNVEPLRDKIYGSYLDFRGLAASRTTFIPHPVRRLSVVLDDSAPDVEHPPGIQSSCIR
jgi:hypothetical protein